MGETRCESIGKIPSPGGEGGPEGVGRGMRAITYDDMKRRGLLMRGILDQLAQKSDTL